MKKILFISFILFTVGDCPAQSVAINNDGSSPDASAILDLKSTSKGLLVPRMTTAERNGIGSPAEGLNVFDTNTKTFWVYNGASWVEIVAGNNGWSVTGNALTNPVTNFIGTTDNQPLRFKVNNAWAGEIHPTSRNVFFGLGSGQTNTSGIANTAIGKDALFTNTTGIRNTANGNMALYSNTSGSYNIAIGNGTLYSNTTGFYNTANGYAALFYNTTGSHNTANGKEALLYSGAGSYNTAIGAEALSNNVGSYNIAIGYRSGTFDPYDNTISIGNNGWLNGYHNQAFIGNASTTWIGGWVGWSIYSDARIKTKITEDVKGLDFITRLRPVTYHRSISTATQISGNKETEDYPEKYDVEKIKFSGFLAQDVEQAANEAGYTFSGLRKPKTKNDLYSLTYESFVVPLVKAVQEQQAIIETLQKKVEAARAEIPMQTGKQKIVIENQQKQIELLEKRLAALEARK